MESESNVCDEQRQRYNEFISIVSHEFRTPLTSIQGFIDTLLTYGDQLPKEQQQHCLQIMRHQTARLTRLVERLLSLSKLEGRRLPLLKFRSLPLAPVLATVEETLMGKQGSSSRLRFDWQLPPSDALVWAEPDALEQVLLNVLDNACKYSPATRPVNVRIHPLAATGEGEAALCIQVQDEGAGMSEVEQEQLFTRFYRASSSLTQQVEGSGLGLYITQQLLQQLGGSIALTSEIGRGTCVSITLPQATQAKEAAFKAAILPTLEASS